MCMFRICNYSGGVISVYANLYVAYHNNVYFALQMNLLEMQGENVSLHRKKIEKKLMEKRGV